MSFQSPSMSFELLQVRLHERRFRRIHPESPCVAQARLLDHPLAGIGPGDNDVRLAELGENGQRRLRLRDRVVVILLADLNLVEGDYDPAIPQAQPALPISPMLRP